MEALDACGLLPVLERVMKILGTPGNTYPTSNEDNGDDGDDVDHGAIFETTLVSGYPLFLPLTLSISHAKYKDVTMRVI